ncbi:MAG: phosphoribosylformylglycinamidine synthase [Flavobacteriia bacterium]|nr:phosphoribosylformylglycinamidine synthase [Flavobacteriia bacterium]OJX39070.1 MAG: hypothetical protein BGO87_03530 [Flavobacteriia bacterium 40-80]
MNVIKTYLSAVAIVTFAGNGFTQTTVRTDKVSHAEPLYFDLVRDLGARKGEKEFNAGFDFSNFRHYNKNAFLVEYEFAPINRLGFEVEADFSFFKRAAQNAEIPDNKLECLRFSTQYSFFISTRLKTTLAVGYTQLVEFTDFRHFGKNNLVTGTAYNPFFIAAKRWGENFHTLIYASPLLEHDFATNKLAVNWQINSSFLYTIPHTKHFIGVELNKEINNGKFEITIRPQVKIKLSKKMAIGLITGIPINKKNESYNSFLRIIYEP